MERRPAQGQRLPISAAILTRNEADRLPGTLAPLQEAVAEIVVLDAESDDATVAVAKAAGARVVVEPWAGYVAARQRLLALTTQPWVLMLDADERLDPRFWERLLATGFPDVPWNGVVLRRYTRYLGRVLRYAWQPDWKPVLWRREGVRIVGGHVHERVEVPPPVVRWADVPLIHDSYRSLRDHYERILRYAELAAADLAVAGQRAHWWDLSLRPAWHFLRQLLLKGAWRDGLRGWLVAGSAAFNAFARYAFLYASRRDRTCG